MEAFTLAEPFEPFESTSSFAADFSTFRSATFSEAPVGAAAVCRHAPGGDEGALRTRIPGRFFAARGWRHPSQAAAARVTWDDFEAVPRLARDAGLEPWLYVSVFDEGFPLAPARERRSSHHNAMHGQHVAWQSDLTRRHPEWLTVDRSGRVRQAGVVCLAYPEARRAFVERWTRLLDGTGFAGLFVCLRSQSRPAAHGDEFGFNEPVRIDYQMRYGRDIAREDFDVAAWRDLLGSYLTALIAGTREALRRTGRRLAVGAPQGDVLGPPLGNATLAWRDWIARGLLDALVVGQNSSQCPSMWHPLWPMHRGTGYVQDYLSGRGLPPLAEYAVAIARATRDSPQLAVGASPRGSLALMKLARARAAYLGRDFVTPDDIKAVSVPALAHRLTLAPELWVQRIDPAEAVRAAVASVAVPVLDESS